MTFDAIVVPNAKESFLSLRLSVGEVPAINVPPTGRSEEVPESPYNAASLESGWELLWMERCDHEFIGEDWLRRLSAGCEVVAVSVEEHVMASVAEGWKDGRRLWRLVHESEQGQDHLEVAGTPPVDHRALMANALEMKRKQGSDAADHVFDVPLNVAKTLTGFKHDEGGPDEFEILERVAKPGPGGFWGRRFGKR
jgi:hypothetical protein